MIGDNMKNNYVQIQPNTQYFTELEQILGYVKLMNNKNKFDDKWLEIGLENTIKNGYELIKK
jgi:hypothetical protein